VKRRREESLCRAVKGNGERCRAFADSSGFCSLHRDPVRQRELAKAGGEARRRGLAERLPEAEARNLRDVLREDLDPRVVLEAMRQALTGGNESARVAAVKFLADLEIYRRDEPKVEQQMPVVELDPDVIIEKLKDVGLLAPFLTSPARLRELPDANEEADRRRGRSPKPDDESQPEA
jgi:Family of unknown function (DUF5763)